MLGVVGLALLRGAEPAPSTILAVALFVVVLLIPGLVSLLLALFQQVSLASPLANAIAIPVISLVVVPLTLAGCIPLFGFLLFVADSVVVLCMWFLEFLSSSGAAVWETHAPRTVVRCARAVFGVAWLLLPHGFPARWLGLAAFVPLFAARPELPGEGDLRLTVLDVRQGLAVVAQTRHHALLYDAGPDFGGGAAPGGSS